MAAVKDESFDWLQKPCDEERLLDAVKAALDQAVVAASSRGKLTREQWNSLAGRETEVAGQARLGKQNKKIEKILGIYGRTV